MKTLSINPQVLDEYYAGSTEVIEEVFTEFLAKHAEIKKGLAEFNPPVSGPELKRLLHYYGPSFMYAGLPEVSSIFKQLENECITPVMNENDFQTAFTEMVQMVDESHNLIQQELDKIRNTPPVSI